jgi:hypothetical protein
VFFVSTGAATYVNTPSNTSRWGPLEVVRFKDRLKAPFSETDELY